MNAPMALARQQQALARWLLHADRRRAPDILADNASQRSARLRLYADAYRLRLIDVLAQDMPVLQLHLGQAQFAALSGDYLATHPSSNPSVRHVGAHLPQWLNDRDDIDAAIADLARFEWLQGEVFDAADAPACTVEELADLPFESWPILRLALHPAVRCARLASNAVALVDAHARGLPLPVLRAGVASAWLLWRVDFDVHWRRLPDDEAAALDAVAHGATFADWCAQLPLEQPALRAAGLLKRWLSDGLVTGLLVAH